MRGIAGGLVTTLAGCVGTVEENTADGGRGVTGAPAIAVPTLGAVDAPITLASFSDYQCSHCRTYHLDVVPKIVEKYIEPGQVRYEQHDFPIPLNEWSWNVPLAARSVQANEGEAAFFAFSKAAFEAQTDMGWSTIRDIASDVGADSSRVVSDAKNAVYESVVEADRQRGVDLGVEGTPTFYVDGTELEPEKSWWYTVDTGLQKAVQSLETTT